MDIIDERFAGPSETGRDMVELSGELLDRVAGGDATPPLPDQPPRRV